MFIVEDIDYGYQSELFVNGFLAPSISTGKRDWYASLLLLGECAETAGTRSHYSQGTRIKFEDEIIIDFSEFTQDQINVINEYCVKCYRIWSLENS